MALKNTTTAYGSLSKLLHWLMALLIIGLLCVGIYMSEMERGPEKFQLYALHKSFGVIALGLFAIRLLWTLSNPRPIALGTPGEQKLAAAVKHMMYLLMLLMPLSGLVMSWSGGHTVALFGLELPSLLGEDKARGEVARTLHGLGMYLFVLMIVLHVGGALKHHFINKDDTLRRML
jgi:cytochrome b561